MVSAFSSFDTVFIVWSCFHNDCMQFFMITTTCVCINIPNFSSTVMSIWAINIISVIVIIAYLVFTMTTVVWIGDYVLMVTMTILIVVDRMSTFITMDDQVSFR